jgi:hypothetical protein
MTEQRVTELVGVLVAAKREASRRYPRRFIDGGKYAEAVKAMQTAQVEVDVARQELWYGRKS